MITNDESNVLPLIEAPSLNSDELEDAKFRARDRAWSAVVTEFLSREEREGLTYKRLGDRIGKSRSQVQRWLSSAFNMNIGSLGLLAEGLNSELEINLVPRCREGQRHNFCHPIESAHALIEARGGAVVVVGALSSTVPPPVQVAAPSATRISSSALKLEFVDYHE